MKAELWQRVEAADFRCCSGGGGGGSCANCDSVYNLQQQESEVGKRQNKNRETIYLLSHSKFWDVLGNSFLSQFIKKYVRKYCGTTSNIGSGTACIHMYIYDCTYTYLKQCFDIKKFVCFSLLVFSFFSEALSNNCIESK